MRCPGTATKHAFGVETEKTTEKTWQLLEPSAMKTILSLVVTTGLLIGSAATYAQQGSTPTGAAQQGSTFSGAAQRGSTFSGAAPSDRAGQSGTLPGQQMQERGARDRNGLIVAPGAGKRRVERRERIRRNRGQDDVTVGRGDRGGCTTQTYAIPSERTGNKTSVGVTRC
jgi:hypothetical protein